MTPSGGHGIAGSPGAVHLLNLEVRGGRVRCDFATTDNLERYRRKGPLEVNFDIPVDAVDHSVLYIPFVAAVLPLAYVTGADITVRTLDSGYLRSVLSIQDELRAWRPGVPFRTKIATAEAKNNHFAKDGRGGLLFSGGLDSTASYLMHKDRVSTLIMVGGTEDMPLEDRKYWEKVRNLTSLFAKKNGATLHFVESNWLKALRASELMKDYSGILSGPDHRDEIGNWEGIFRMILLGMCAPVAATEQLATLHMASTFPTEVVRSLGRHGPIEETLTWGDLSVVRDTQDLTRQQKIEQIIAPYLAGNQEQIPLRVCHPIRFEKNRKLRQKGMLNCSDCEKCHRTILGLVLEGVDPRRCGFEKGSFSPDRVRKQLSDRSVLLTNATMALWTEIKQRVGDRPPQAVQSDLWGCNGFFDWLVGYDLTRNLLTSADSVNE